MAPPRSHRLSRRSSGETTACERPDSRTNFVDEFEAKVNDELHKGLLQADTESASVILPTATSPGFGSESVLVRGLQVPTKSKRLSSGFKYPDVLEISGVSKESWATFTSEVKQHANMDASQWLTVLGKSALALGVGNLMIGFFGVIPAVIVGQKLRKKQEKANFKAADQSGVLADCVKRWNDTYFLPRKLVVRVDIPGEASDMAAMDVSTSKSFQQGIGQSSFYNPDISGNARYSDAQVEETRARIKAARRGRIVIIPANASDVPELSGSRESSPSATNSLDGVVEVAEEEGMAQNEAVTMFGHVTTLRHQSAADSDT
ncbi:hypothetical protein MMC30_000580 [Trapelia coarctata]|nr:hypothetical protein [Trapelia coarctata]